MPPASDSAIGGLLGLDRPRPAQVLGRLTHAEHLRRNPAGDGVRRHVLGYDRVRPQHRIVADPRAAQHARAVADPHVGADLDRSLVDPLPADWPVDLRDAMVEVDEHRAVRDHALIADAHVLVRGDRAFLSQHGLRSDFDGALVAADLGPVADPGKGAEADRAPLADLELEPLAEEDGAVGFPAPARGREEAPPQIAPQQAGVAGVQHPVRGEEPDRADQGGLESTGDSTPRLRRVVAQTKTDAEQSLAERVLAGEGRALARAISLVENRDPKGDALVAELFPRTGKARIVGLTGPPGVGKSTLIGALTKELRSEEHDVGVLSIDPSSPFTRGAVLGDRIRLSDHFLDPGVFIRSMATRGSLGGLAEAALQAALLMDASGKDYVLLETVGVGQGEIDVVDHADTIVLALMPGSGDSIQALKAGVMEIPDVIVVNKSDHPLADTMVREVRAVLSLGPRTDWKVPVVRTEATREEGIIELLDRIDTHRAHIERTGSLAERRARNLRAEVLGIAAGRIRRRLDERAASDPGWEELLERVVRR